MKGHAGSLRRRRAHRAQPIRIRRFARVIGVAAFLAAGVASAASAGDPALYQPAAALLRAQPEHAFAE